MKNGFTLIELLVVIAIIGIVSSAVMLIDRSSSEEIKLNRAVEQLAQDLAEMREMALGAIGIPCNPPTIISRLPGFSARKILDLDTSDGIAWNKKYTLFADCVVAGPDKNTFTGNDVIIRKVILSAGVKIKNVNPQQGNALNIVFHPPEPLVRFTKDGLNNQAEITLCLEADESIEGKVVVNKAGKIEIE